MAPSVSSMRSSSAQGSPGSTSFTACATGLGFRSGSSRQATALAGPGTWNRYPGARCDSESYYYSYSFSKELQQEWEWTERYPAQSEIMRYLDHVADRFDLRRDIQFGTRVTEASFDRQANRWHIGTASGERFAAKFLITAVGCLSAANTPEINGLETFEGKWHHTGRWPHDGVDFAGQRVGLIGTGSTGIQAAPVIAEAAAHLTVFQRTPNFSVPARNAPMTPEFQGQVKANYDEIRRKTRASTNGHPFDISERPALDTAPDERRALYEAAWEQGGLRFRATFKDLLINKEANDTAAEFIRSKIREIVKDPAVAEKLTPYDHPFAAKRPPIDTNYFETFNRPNVSLVNVREAPIERITPNGVKTSDAEYALDIIVFATGFDALTGPLLSMDIRGEDGRSLKEAWAAGPRTYLGLQVAGFPNLFTITGPGSPSVLCNMPVPIEQHVEWVENCIAYMRERHLERIEATAEAADRWVAHVNEAANATLLPLANSSWYLGANIPGKPRVFMPYAGGMARYRQICDEVAARDYEGFLLSH